METTILIIEDEPSIVDNILYALKAEGLKGVWSSTGEDAQQKLLQIKADLIVLDIGLPDINGFELCREIKTKFSTIPIIFLTARSDEVDRVVGLELGADDYMVKPFSLRELMARIRAVLRRTKPNASTSAPVENNKAELGLSAVGYGPFSLDEKRCIITYFGQPLLLSSYEYRLLRVFLTRPGRVLSRGQLKDLAWEDPESSMERTIDAHIKSIRAKLKRIQPEEDPIQTHRGMGYSLKDLC